MESAAEQPLATKRFEGFTLTELLIVVTILGILAAVAVPRFFPQAEKSRVSEAVSVLSAIREAERVYFLERGSYVIGPVAEADWAPLGIGTPSGTYFTYTVETTSLPSSPAFVAIATRKVVRDSGGYSGKTIQVNKTGAYSGTHPFVPPN